MGAPEAVIFDVDGTLLNWDASIHNALIAVQAEYEVLASAELVRAFPLAVTDYAFVIRGGFVADRRHWMLFVDPLPPWRRVLPGMDDGTVTAIAHRFRSLLRPVRYDDVLPALAALRSQHRLAVLSNNPRVETVVEQLGIRHFFEAVVAAPEGYRKPDPRAFLETCDAIGAKPGDCAYVGDSLLADVAGAQGAGLNAVFLDRYSDGHPLPAGVSRITALEDLLRLFAPGPR